MLKFKKKKEEDEEENKEEELRRNTGTHIEPFKTQNRNP